MMLRLSQRHSLEAFVADGKAEPFRTECGGAAGHAQAFTILQLNIYRFHRF